MNIHSHFARTTAKIRKDQEHKEHDPKMRRQTNLRILVYCFVSSLHLRIKVRWCGVLVSCGGEVFVFLCCVLLFVCGYSIKVFTYRYIVSVLHSTACTLVHCKATANTVIVVSA